MEESRCLHTVSPVLSDTSDLFMWLIPDSDISLNLDKLHQTIYYRPMPVLSKFKLPVTRRIIR